jgi:HD-GYP domain-containing protein (c-di-GMP phosphodiesterase class II)
MKLALYKGDTHPSQGYGFVHIESSPSFLETVSRKSRDMFQTPVSSYITLFVQDENIQDMLQILEIEGWLDGLDIRTKEPSGHIFRVTQITAALARLAGIPKDEVVKIKLGALFHDIGNVGLSESILFKLGKLTGEEWDAVHKHPVYAQDLLNPVEYLRECLSIPYSHHEKWDGTGYPQRLKGEEIPLYARLFAVVDVWDRLSSNRVNRKAWHPGRVMEHIRQQSGLHFDPAIVDLFLRSRQKLTGQFGLPWT